MTYALIWLACGVGALGWLLFFVARHGHHDSYCTGHDDGFSDGWKACEAFAAHPLLSLTLLLFVCIFFWPGIFLADLKKGFSR